MSIGTALQSIGRTLTFRKGSPSDELSAEQKMMLWEVYAKLSGLGEPPQLGSRVTLADIQRAIRTSEIGEPYYMFALNRDMIENDAHLQAEIGKRIMSFMGQEEKFKPFDKKNKDDVIATEVAEDMRTNCENWNSGCTHLALGHIWPVAGAEKIYEKINEDDRRKWRHPVQFRLKKLHPVPWPLFTYKIAYWNAAFTGAVPGSGFVPMSIISSGGVPMMNTTGNAIGNNPALIWNANDWHADLRFYGTLQNGLIDWSLATCYKPDKVRHVLHSANVATVSFRENFGSILRSLIPIWFYKKNLLDWLASKMERYGGPFSVVNAPLNNKNISDAIAKAFDNAVKINAIMVPPQAKIELKEINYTNMADAFIKSIELMNDEMTKAILGQTLSTKAKGMGMQGGSGTADLHGEVKEEWSLFDKREFSEMQRIQIIDDFLRFNGYKGRCRIVRGGLNSQAQAMRARTLQSLYLSGIRVPKDEEESLEDTFGQRLEVFDPNEEKQEKSKSDKQRYGNPANETKQE